MASLCLLLFYYQTICQNVELCQNLNFAKMLFEFFQSMNCFHITLSKLHQLLCCPGGTTAFEGGRPVSFVPNRDPRCSLDGKTPQKGGSASHFDDDSLQYLFVPWLLALIFIGVTLLFCLKRLCNRD